jgi:alpha,alpha-trehalase
MFKTLNFVVFLTLIKLSRTDKRHACESKIYCYGKLIDTVMRAEIYEDPKDFVDLRMKISPNETLESFNKFMNKYNDAPSQVNLYVWLKENFDKPESELKNIFPVDFKEKPSFLKKIKNHHLRTFGSDLNKIWKNLTRRISHDVKVNKRLLKF